MSESQPPENRMGAHSSSPVATDFGQDVMDSIQALSQPVEMSDLHASKAVDPASSDPAPGKEERTDETKNASIETEDSSQPQQDTQPSESYNVSSTHAESAIGPATDRPTRIRSTSESGPQLIIILLLHSTHTRHPYLINEKYLKRRNVNVADNDPVNMTVYTLKELIWRDWREEWEARPASPTSIRLIHMGRMLDDKSNLKESRFSCGETPHVVHMTMKPQEVIDDEDARMAKGSNRDRDGNERTPCCRCSVM